MRRLLSCFRRLWSDRSGNIALIFALAVVPVMGAMGAAVDYSIANASRTAMQAALDNTGLMLSKMMPLSQTDLNTKGWQMFTGNLGNSPVVMSSSSLVIDASTTGKLVLDVSGTYTVGLGGVLQLVGMNPSFPVGAHSEVQWGSARLRVALVLDNTGSMSTSNKMNALKTATTNLLSQLHSAASVNGDVYVSIIPFVKDVNVGGASNYNATWGIDWTAWDAPPANSTPSASVGPGSNCPYTSGTNGFTCTTGPANGSSTTSNIPSSGTYTGYICPSYDNGSVNTHKLIVYYNGCYNSVQKPSHVVGTGALASCSGFSNCTCSGSGSAKVCTQTFPGQYNHTWISNAHSTWNGCVTDRGVPLPGPGTTGAADYDQNVTAPTAGVTASLFPAEQYALCPLQMIGLTYDWTALNNLVSLMTPTGSTNQPIGLVWGWQSLVGGGPFPAAPAFDPNYTYNQVIILLSDGLNTEDRWNSFLDPNPNVDTRMYYQSGSTVTGTCKNIKSAGITIYTVQVDTDGAPLSTLLQNCASDTSKFFLLMSSSEIVTTFQQIGTALANLHLSK